MISLTHLNGREFHMNCELILFLETTPDTLVVMTNGDKIMVKESPEEIVERVVSFKRRVFPAEAQLHILYGQMPPPPEPGEET
jgi:flagellar protein FlbD